MKTFIISENYVGVKEIEDDLQEFYGIIDCDCIDIVTRYVDDKKYDIILDDEGLLKENPRVSAIAGNMTPMLFGNLIVTGVADFEGNLTSLTDEDCQHISENLAIISVNGVEQDCPVLANVNYYF